MKIFTRRVEKSLVPIPPELVGLSTIRAEPWLQIDPSPDRILEGPAFDRTGNLFITSIAEGRVLKITSQKQVTTIFNNKYGRTIGCAIHKDGRLFIACATGELIALSPDGSNVTYITPRYQGKPKELNDLVFDPSGNLYVTDFIGTVPDPVGGVYRFSFDIATVQPVLEHLAGPNGISLAPEGNVLWVGEHNRNAVLRIQLLQDGVTIRPPGGVCYAYYSTGAPGGPDSNKVDVQGNLYQCIMAHGRVVILNAHGIPVANVVVPGRDEGKHLRTPNLAFKPGTSEAYLCVSGEGGAWIYRFKGLADGLPLFSHK